MSARGKPIVGERRERVLRLIRENPDASNRQIARQAGIDHKTVASIRNAPAPTTAAPWSRDATIVSFCRLLNADLAATLDDLTRILRDQAGRIAEIPPYKRLAWTRSYIASLGITVADLGGETPFGLKPGFTPPAGAPARPQTAAEHHHSGDAPLSPVSQLADELGL